MDNPTQVKQNPPIVIYQMGKVGSQTIWKSLQKMNIPNPIYHIHVLNPENINKAIKVLNSKGAPFTVQLKQAQNLIAYLEQQESPRMKVITIVREPIVQLLSSLFQRMKVHFPQFINPDGSYKVDEITRYVYETVCHKKINAFQWFDKEFKQGLGINIYDYQFDTIKGYGQIKKDHLEVLILRLESSEHWEQKITDFLELSTPFKMLNKNKAEGKKYKEAYNKVKSGLKFPREILEEIYSSKYCQHFYTSEMNQIFLNQWKHIE
jgi:hypothetical protein